MNISGITPNYQPSMDMAAGAAGGSPDSRIQALEQKLSQLQSDKQKAVQNHDEERKKALEKQIQKVEQEIERLKRQMAGQKEPAAASRNEREQPPKDPEKGQYIDEAV